MRKTILFINGHLDIGGCERSLVDVLKNIDYNKYDVDLLLLEHMGDYFCEIPKEVNVKLYSLDNSFGSFAKCLLQALKRHDSFSFFFRIGYTIGERVDCRLLRRLRKLFKGLKKSYDIIIAYRPGICTELAAFTFSGRKKISWWHHGTMNVLGSAANRLHKAYREMDSIIAVSMNSLALVKETFPDIKDKLTVIPNMIIPFELRRKAGEFMVNEFQNARIKIISVGRMSPEKNMILCPQIAACLKIKGYDFRWILIGDGEDEKCILSMINKYGLQENMIMLGKKSNPYPYIAAADVMVHPSLVESQGITLLESMALSTPVIAVASAGPKEFIISGKNGFLVSPDGDEIAGLVEKVCMDSSFRDKIIVNAETTVRQFESEYIIRQIEKIMEA